MPAYGNVDLKYQCTPELLVIRLWFSTRLHICMTALLSSLLKVKFKFEF